MPKSLVLLPRNPNGLFITSAGFVSSEVCLSSGTQTRTSECTEVVDVAVTCEGRRWLLCPAPQVSQSGCYAPGAPANTGLDVRVQHSAAISVLSAHQAAATLKRGRCALVPRAKWPFFVAAVLYIFVYCFLFFYSINMFLYFQKKNLLKKK